MGPELLSVFKQASIAWHDLFHIKSEGARKVEGAGSQVGRGEH